MVPSKIIEEVHESSLMKNEMFHGLPVTSDAKTLAEKEKKQCQ